MRCGRGANSGIRVVYMFTLRRVDIDGSADSLGLSQGGCACRRCGKSEEEKRGKAKAGAISGEGGFPGRAPPQAEARSEARGVGGSRSLSTLAAAAGNAGTRPWAEQEGDGGGGGGDVPLIDFISLAATASRVRALSCEPLAPLAKPTTGLNCENSSRITSFPPADIAAVFAVSQGKKINNILRVSGESSELIVAPFRSDGHAFFIKLTR